MHRAEPLQLDALAPHPALKDRRAHRAGLDADDVGAFALPPQGGYHRLAGRLVPDTDAQKMRNARLVEMPNHDAAFPQPGLKPTRIGTRVAGEQKIGGRYDEERSGTVHGLRW